MIKAVPGDTPHTLPVALTVAMVTSLLLQVPPGVVLDNVVQNPIQVLAGPVSVAGSGFTVTFPTVKHPVGSV